MKDGAGREPQVQRWEGMINNLSVMTDDSVPGCALCKTNNRNYWNPIFCLSFQLKFPVLSIQYTLCYPATALLRSATMRHYQRLITLEFSIFCQDWSTIYVLMSWSLLYVFFGSFHLIWHDAHRVHSPAFNASIPLSMVFRFLMLKLEIIKVMHGSA